MDNTESFYTHYKYYIISLLDGLVKQEHIEELGNRIKAGIITTDELYVYNDLYSLKYKKDLPTYKQWYREQRFKNLLD